VADHTRDDSIAAIARRTLATAPPRFALVGLSMGGYVAFEIMRQAPERVARLALLDTAPGPRSRRRRRRGCHSSKWLQPDVLPKFPTASSATVHTDRHGDAALKALVRTMAEETGRRPFCAR